MRTYSSPRKSRLATGSGRREVTSRCVMPSAFEFVKQCTEKSLRNLRRDTLDLQQFHVWNAEWANDREWQKSVEWLKTTGKARFIGISTNDHEPASVITALRTGLVDLSRSSTTYLINPPPASYLPFVRNSTSV